MCMSLHMAFQSGGCDRCTVVAGSVSILLSVVFLAYTHHCTDCKLNVNIDVDLCHTLVKLFVLMPYELLQI